WKSIDGRSMARSTLSGMLVGPGLAKKCRPRGFETVLLMRSTSCGGASIPQSQGRVKRQLLLTAMHDAGSSEERLGRRAGFHSVGLAADRGEFVPLLSRQVAIRQSHAPVAREPRAVACQEVPVQRGERTGIVAGRLVRIVAAVPAMIAHPVDV